MTCTFFGHRDCPENIRVNLRNSIVELIKHKDVDYFLVGNNGDFDSYVLRALRECKMEFPFIDYCVVLAYLPQNAKFDYPTLYPEGIEKTPKRFAISYRNNYMIKQSDFVIAYVSRTFGGAYTFFEKAKLLDKTCINLYKIQGGAP